MQKNKNKPRIIAFDPTETEAFYLARTCPGWRFFCLSATGSDEDRWIKIFFETKNIISYSLRRRLGSFDNSDYNESIPFSDFTQVIKKAGIKNFWLTVNSGNFNFLKKWSKQNNINIIGSQFDWQRKLEDKIWFDRFLKINQLPSPASQVYKYGDKVELTGKLVLQDPWSSGAEGTFFLQNKRDLKDLLVKDKIKKNRKYLLREFMVGEPLGVTVFIGHDKIFLSQLRRQCFFGSSYIGLQWIKTSDFSATARQNMNSVFRQMGKILLSMGITGSLSFDFILTSENQVYLIECNPRFSAAMKQIVGWPETVGGRNVGKFMIDLYLNKMMRQKIRKIAFFSYLPIGNFQGSQLDLYGIMKRGKKKSMILPSGVYGYKHKKIEFKTSDIRQAIKFKQSLAYIDFRGGLSLPKNDNQGAIISDFPLYDSEGGLNQAGKIILEKFL